MLLAFTKLLKFTGAVIPEGLYMLCLQAIKQSPLFEHNQLIFIALKFGVSTLI